MSSIWITIKKELRSIFRDKKTLLTLLLFPLFIPAMIFLYCYMYEGEADVKRYDIGVDYSLNQTERKLLNEANLDALEYDNLKDMENDYKKGSILGYIDYDKDSKHYVIYTNEDSTDGMYVGSYITQYLESYNQYLANLYFTGQDIDVEKAYDNFSYENVNLDGENWILQLIFTISFTYIIMAIVIAVTNMATSATAVEKENGTLETILTFPILSRDLVIGKYLSCVVMGFLSSIIGFVLTIISLVIAKRSFSLFSGIDIHYSVSVIIMSLLIITLASFFIAGVGIALTSRAHSYKEAQSYSSVLNILTIIPMMISLMDISIESVYYFIPILNYTQMLLDIFSGKINYFNLLIVIVSSIIYVFIVIRYIIYQYRTERVLFG